MLHIFENLPDRPSANLPRILEAGERLRDKDGGTHRVEGVEILIDGANSCVYVETRQLRWF